MHQTNPTVMALYVGTINGSSVRFFLSPIRDGRPDFPWSSFDDLTIALKLPEKSKDWTADWLRRVSAEAMTIATNDGMTTVIPHPDAQGFVLAVKSLQGVDAEADYKFAGATAFNRQLAEMPDKDIMAYAQAAIERWRK